MATLPHDVTDLSLAPVALAIDARIEELSRLNAADLAFQIALEGDEPAWTAEFRAAGLLDTMRRFIDVHDWELSMDTRGVRLTHKQHTLVLGLPDTLRAYLSGS